MTDRTPSTHELFEDAARKAPNLNVSLMTGANELRALLNRLRSTAGMLLSHAEHGAVDMYGEPAVAMPGWLVDARSDVEEGFAALSALIASREAAVKPGIVQHPGAGEFFAGITVPAPDEAAVKPSGNDAGLVAGELDQSDAQGAEYVVLPKGPVRRVLARLESLTRELDKAREAIKVAGDSLASSTDSEAKRVGALLRLNAALSATTDLGRDTENAG